ncbi:hypothetical protein U3516DRAFT_870945 [Neocallimastix sp. 'constans']
MEKNQKIEISKNNRGKEQIILNRRYKFNLSFKRKDISKNINNQVIEYDDSHNHLENKFVAAKSIVKNKIKNEISNSSIPVNVNIKHKYDKISQGMGLIRSGYNSIKSQVTRSRRKQLPPDITTFDEIPNESKYYKTKRDENFMIFKNNDLIVFQSLFQAELFLQMAHFILHLYLVINTSFSILKNKKQTTYEILFKEIKKNSSKYNSIENTPKIFHCDFEKAISKLYFKRALEIKKKELCDNKVERIKDLYIYYNNISNFPFINPEYIYDIYMELQKEESKYYIDYERRIAGILKNKKQKKNLILTKEIKALVKYYKNMVILFKKKKRVRNDFIELWLECLNDLNIKIID